jgi:predicted HTH transcriptional regulator
MIEQAVDFILSKINLYVGDRSQKIYVDVEYEIPRRVVTESIVNAVCHRDYTSNGSVQVMLFADRLEVSNPANFPHELTVEQLYTTHRSIPANPLLAEAMYLRGTIERMGTGTEEMTKECIANGLARPEFIPDYGFQTVIRRNNNNQSEQVPDKYPTSTGQVPNKYRTSTGQVPDKQTIDNIQEEIRRLIMVLRDESSRSEIQSALGLKHRENFVLKYLNPAIEQNYIEPLYPDVPNHPQQKYRLTEKGRDAKENL